ncbi:Autoinhibited H(+)-ATPase isoform 1 [Hibiscus syriacus]|uniref:Autoinhibited H(+)-ATPase isoform 1 n=1 Tax=Hibiscus syriacus TaxID=106335 RepID=A0A6A3AW12_HIBSY|nr:Autoinhibited H(+)-ATPase isoform 1 [Hibiscus syriacus]
MDLCLMASKLAYGNAEVMHFVDFYDCWDDYQKEKSTQVFLLCDKPKDANLILISFRGTDLFDADDWSTDFDYSWYEIPNLGKLHMGFLEALGLGNREDTTYFYHHLQKRSTKHSFSERSAGIVTGHSLGGALAILFPTVLVLHEETELLQKLLGVYTFGQPRIGNRQIGRFVEAHLDHPVPKYFRVVYYNDLVPRLPYDDKTFLYKHFGVCLYYNSCYIEQELMTSLAMGYAYGPEYKEGWFSIFIRLLGLLIPGISAHCITNYVNSIRLGKFRGIRMSSD